jgi:endonuclease/exonuclease/phosphatase family metal-dependent hydrolase
MGRTVVVVASLGRASGLTLPVVLAGACASAPPAAPAPTLRVATFNASLYRDEAGVLRADIAAGDEQARAIASILIDVGPDVVLLNEIDPDAVDAFADAFADRPYPYRFVPPSNTGVPTGFDLDRDGTTDGPGDARGYGRYPGQYGMAVLSRFPITETRCFGDLPWSSFAWAELPDDARSPAPADYYASEVQAVLPLSSKNHCDVTVDSPLGDLHLLISHPTPPAFDGPEDRNGHRNRDEILFWVHHIDTMSPEARFVVLGDLNADPSDGDTPDGITALLDHPRLIDPKPRSKGAAAAAREQEKANADHRGEPALDTADFDDDVVGNLRVDYALPSRTLKVRGSGVHWPEPEDASPPAPSDHHLVWVDISLQ